MLCKAWDMLSQIHDHLWEQVLWGVILSNDMTLSICYKETFPKPLIYVVRYWLFCKVFYQDSRFLWKWVAHHVNLVQQPFLEIYHNRQFFIINFNTILKNFCLNLSFLVDFLKDKFKILFLISSLIKYEKSSVSVLSTFSWQRSLSYRN